MANAALHDNAAPAPDQGAGAGYETARTADRSVRVPACQRDEPGENIDVFADPHTGAVVAIPLGMSPQPALDMTDVRRDGYGARRIEQDPRCGRVEVLE